MELHVDEEVNEEVLINEYNNLALNRILESASLTLRTEWVRTMKVRVCRSCWQKLNSGFTKTNQRVRRGVVVRALVSYVVE